MCDNLQLWIHRVCNNLEYFYNRGNGLINFYLVSLKSGYKKITIPTA